MLPTEGAAPAGAISLELRRHVAADLKTEMATEAIAGALVTASLGSLVLPLLRSIEGLIATRRASPSSEE